LKPLQGFREIATMRRLLPILFLTTALAACGGDEDEGSGAPDAEPKLFSVGCQKLN
jgi:hypothetical protein